MFCGRAIKKDISALLAKKVAVMSFYFDKIKILLITLPEPTYLVE